MNPKFSIVVPCYNLAPWVKECLDSVVAQSFADWECIVVDDESTDDCGAILDGYAGRDSRIRVIHQKNKGEGGARNTGIVAAKGDWIVFLDGDDVLARETLSRVAEIIQAQPFVDLIRFGLIRFNDGDHWEPQVKNNGVLVDISCECSLDILSRYFVQHVFRRRVLEGHFFTSYRRGADRPFLAEVLLNRVSSFYATDDVLYGYRQRQGSAMNSVPRAEVLADELEHRRDLVLMIEASKKQVDYAGSWWLERYFTDEFGALVVEKSAAERAMLWNVWLNCVREMKDAKGLSAHARHVYCICCRFPYRPVFWLVARAYPWYMSRGIIPRGFRKIRRLLTHV